MIKTISSALAAFAVVTFAGLPGQASAQSCSSCSTAPSVNSFNYPAAPVAAGCGHGGCRSGHGSIGSHVHEAKQRLAHTSAINQKAAARNEAWPNPFACWDKQGYYETWRPMLQAGSEVQAVLDTNYFTDANELNRVGIDRVAGIVQNMPTGERTVYVNRSGDDFVDKARMDAIRHTISTYYAQSGPADVRMSNRIPQSVNGADILVSRELRRTSLPPAIIQVGQGESVTEAVGN